MATGIIGPTLGAAQLAATLSGVPFAGGGVIVLQMISATCSQVSMHKVNDLWTLLSFAKATFPPLLHPFLLSRTAKIFTAGSAVHVATQLH